MGEEGGLMAFSGLGIRPEARVEELPPDIKTACD